MSYVEYNYLLCEISQRVDQLNQRKVVFLMCKGRVAPRAQDIPDALFLFQELQDQNKLAIDQVEPLKELLKAIGEWPLFQKVRKFEDKRKEYKELLEVISSALDESNQLQQLIAACTERVTLEESERNSQTARILFEKLEGRELFEFGRLRFLKEILSKIQRQDLVKEIQDFEKRRIDEDDFERWKAQAGDIVQVVRDTGGQIIGALDMKTVCRALGSGLTLLSARAIMNGWSTYDQLVTGIQTCVLPAGLKLIGMGTGCVCFTIQADNLMGLTALWNMYEDGTLKKRLFDFFVTDEMRTLAGGEENVELTVTIGKNEYEKVYFELLREADASTLPPGAAAADASSTKTFGGTTPSSAAVTSRTVAVDRELADMTKKLGSFLGSGEHTPHQTQANSGMHPPLRPGYGTKGCPIALRANFFRLNVSPQLSDLYHYDVEITPERCPKNVKRDVVNEIIKTYKQTTFKGHHPAFDGEKNLYSRIRLPVPAELSLKLPGEDGGRDRVFKVKIQFAAAVSLLELNNFLSGEQNGKIPQDAVQALDIVVRQMPSMYYTPVGRSFFPFDGQRRPLGEGCEVKFGFYSSIRHSEWKAMLVNIDVSAKGFYKEQAVVPDFLCEALDVKPHNLEDYRFEPDRRRLEKAIRGIRIQTTHAGTIKRKYTIWGVSEKSADRKQFDVTDERTGRTSKTTVADYFKDRYRLILRYPHLPCLQVGQKKDRYLPMEVCTIIPCLRKLLSEQQIANMIRSTARPAPERQRDIQHWVQEMTRASSKYLRDEFQTSVSTEMVKVEGRVLPPPRINLGPQDQPLVPRDGSWDMRNKSLHDGARIEKWALACFCRRCREDQLRNFSKQMGNVSSRQGLKMSEEPVVVRYGRGAREVESLFSKWVVDIPGLQLIMAILPERDKQIYPEIKRVGDNVIGIPTQCVQSKHVNRTNPQVCANIALKINSKLGGINHVIDPGVKSPVFREPVIIFGADVTHPSPTENGIPSIAAVVASMDANATKYCARVRAQNHKSGKGAQEIINDLAVMVKELLIEFYKANPKLKPSKIIFYRDGVSEGQFDQVLVHEVRAVQQACIMLEKDYRPRITFVVVQKRHHTRLFCENQRDEVGKARNVPPGTTVDSGITHPYEFDFYLCSHYGIQGTSRPTHYHVLYDDNSFTADGLQQLTYQLCHVYARCTRSVSMPAPAYYAHLVAFRARHHVTGNGSIDLVKSAKAIEVNAKMKGAMYFT